MGSKPIGLGHPGGNFNLAIAITSRAIAKLTQEATSSDKAPEPYYHKGFNYMYRLWNYWISKEPDNYHELYKNNMGEANAIVELVKKVRDDFISCEL